MTSAETATEEYFRWRVVVEPSRPQRYRLREAFIVELDQRTYGDERVLVVPEGFEYDGASVRAPFALVTALAQMATTTPFAPAVMGPACLHDYLYGLEGRGPFGEDRGKVDLIFHQMLLDNRVAERVARRMYTAVRAFGQPYWVNDTQEKMLHQDMITDSGMDMDLGWSV